MTQKKRKRLATGEDAHDKSWVPGQKGQGGEGLSDGYGGSAGVGTGASGPESKPEEDAAGETPKGGDTPSPSLPSRERIAKVPR